jgi:protein-S-isoprenylcysteine O-methyltransferase Ste14
MRSVRAAAGGAVLLYFVIALEVLIMISPFAAFFYAAFNPLLLSLGGHGATRWLASFFLPHMVLPPGAFLKAVRISGSVLFVGGAVVFVVCAGQVYANKLLRRGVALRGLYARIRHPQYLALAATGLGLAILWPRFLTIVLWTVMVALYVLLARDEERRMLAAFGERYRAYMSRTGMFAPRRLERALARVPHPASRLVQTVVGWAALFVVAVGGAFALRAYTVARLPLWSDHHASALAILPADSVMLAHRMEDVLVLPDVRSRLAKGTGAVLVYLVPTQYVMQGMIADTSPRWRLYEHHETMAMIADWILHPFRHLEGGHMMMHHRAGAGTMGGVSAGVTVRRLIFVRVGTPPGATGRAALFSIDAPRVPQFLLDVDMHTLGVIQVKDLGPGTGWGSVPTPMF